MRKKTIFSDNDRQLAVVTTVTCWNEPPRFRHQVTRQLTRFYNVLYVERGYSNQWRDWFCSSYEKINEHLVIYRPPRLPRFISRLYEFVPPIHTAIDYVATKQITWFIKKANYNTALLINFQFNFHTIMKSRFFSLRVYLCNDEFPKSARYLWQQTLFAKFETKVIQGADCCIVHSNPLLKKFKLQHESVHLLLPGHEFKIPGSPVIFNRQERNNKKISVCYMGFIDHRILLNWLLKIVSYDDLQLYLIGPVKSSIDISSLYKFPNFELIPPTEGQELQLLLEKMDVCIIPFNTELEVVKACTPNKTFQYIACGKPIVMSNMDHVVNFQEKIVYMANNEQEFIDQIKKAYQDDCEELVSKRLELAKNNSWDQRGNQLQAVLSGYTH